jgi:transcriptional regulator with XRE-family HTH domain
VQFGYRLRVLREDARLTGKELAAWLGWAQSKVSRIENGRQSVSADEVIAWTAAVGAAAPVRADLLADLHTVRFEYASWRRQLRAGTAPRQQVNVGLEADAALVRVFVPDMIPGLVQTPDYARYVFARLVALHETPNDVEAGVRARLARQQVLYDGSKRFRFLLTEAALRYRICPPQILRAQLDRLAVLAELDTVEVAVLPFTTVLPVVPSHAFTMFDGDLVLVELTGAELAFRDGEEIGLYERVFAALWKVAVHGAAAVDFVLAVSQHTTGAVPSGPGAPT